MVCFITDESKYIFISWKLLQVYKTISKDENKYQLNQIYCQFKCPQ